MCTKYNQWYLLAVENPDKPFGYEVDFDCIAKVTGGMRYITNLKIAKKAKTFFKAHGKDIHILKRTCQALEI